MNLDNITYEDLAEIENKLKKGEVISDEEATIFLFDGCFDRKLVPPEQATKCIAKILEGKNIQESATIVIELVRETLFSKKNKHWQVNVLSKVCKDVLKTMLTILNSNLEKAEKKGLEQNSLSKRERRAFRNLGIESNQLRSLRDAVKTVLKPDKS